MGGVLPPQRRRTLVRWAHAGELVIEDDYDAEFRYNRRPVGALQPLVPEHVTYTEASRALAPGLRLGWLAAPADLKDSLIAAKANTDLSSHGHGTARYPPTRRPREQGNRRRPRPPPTPDHRELSRIRPLEKPWLIAEPHGFLHQMKLFPF